MLVLCITTKLLTPPHLPTYSVPATGCESLSLLQGGMYVCRWGGDSVVVSRCCLAGGTRSWSNPVVQASLENTN